MASALVRAAVDEVLEDWDQSVAPIRRPNEDFTPSGAPWIAVEFPASAIDREDIGDPVAPLWLEAGAFMVHCFTPAGAGDAALTAIADAIWELFRGREVDGVRFDSRLDGQAGPRTMTGTEGTFWGVSYGIAFRLQAVTVP